MKISLGEHSKLTVNPSYREKIRKFYGEVLECRLTKKSNAVDVFKIGESFYLGVVYDNGALTSEESLKSIWLELKADDAGGLKSRILNFGVHELEYWDKEHFYFQAPGGQVFRLAENKEDMTKWNE